MARTNSQSLFKEVGLRIAKARKAKSLTQEQLASKVGLDRSYVGWIEQGRRRPSLQTLQRVSKAVGSSLGDLFKGL